MAIGLVSDNSDLYRGFVRGYEPSMDMFRQIEGIHPNLSLNEVVIEMATLGNHAPGDMPDVYNSYNVQGFSSEMWVTHMLNEELVCNRTGFGMELLQSVILGLVGIVTHSTELKTATEINECKHVQFGFTSDLVETMKLGGF